jgi:GT2 family glycosyltransferase
VATCDVSLVIPTFCRSEALSRTLQSVLRCEVQPREVLVHVDFGDSSSIAFLRNSFPFVRILVADRTTGPGGARNRLIRAATFECVVSLDDDSWPEHSDFFSLAVQALKNHTDAGVLACDIRERDEADSVGEAVVCSEKTPAIKNVPSFVGCGAVIRRSAFLETNGYLPLKYAYGMEELDVSLQLLDLGYDIVYCEELKVYHDCERSRHHADRRINAAQIRNTALLAFLRYPLKYLPLGILQTANRVAFCVRKRRWAGILEGIFSIPGSMWKFRKQRRSVTAQTLHHFRGLRKGFQRDLSGR